MTTETTVSIEQGRKNRMAEQRSEELVWSLVAEDALSEQGARAIIHADIPPEEKLQILSILWQHHRAAGETQMALLVLEDGLAARRRVTESQE